MTCSMAKSASPITLSWASTSAHTGTFPLSPILMIHHKRPYPSLTPRSPPKLPSIRPKLPASGVAGAPRAPAAALAPSRKANPPHSLRPSKPTWQLKCLILASAMTIIQNDYELFMSPSKSLITRQCLPITPRAPRNTWRCLVLIKSRQRSPEQQSRCRPANTIRGYLSISQAGLEKANAITLRIQ